MERLSSIWKRIGIQGEQRSSRCSVVLMHIDTLLDDMLREEQALYNRLSDNASRLKTDLGALYSEMGIPAHEVSLPLRV